MAIPVFERGPETIIAYIPVFHGTWPDYSSLITTWITMLHLVKQVSRYIHAMLKLVVLAVVGVVVPLRSVCWYLDRRGAGQAPWQ